MMTMLIPNTRTFARASGGSSLEWFAHWNFFQKSCDKKLLSVSQHTDPEDRGPRRRRQRQRWLPHQAPKASQSVRPALHGLLQDDDIVPVAVATAIATPTTPLSRTQVHLYRNTVKMLLLDYQNVLIQSVLTERFSG